MWQYLSNASASSWATVCYPRETHTNDEQLKTAEKTNNQEWINTFAAIYIPNVWKLVFAFALHDGQQKRLIARLMRKNPYLKTLQESVAHTHMQCLFFYWTFLRSLVCERLSFLPAGSCVTSAQLARAPQSLPAWFISARVTELLMPSRFIKTKSSILIKQEVHVDN